MRTLSILFVVASCNLGCRGEQPPPTPAGGAGASSASAAAGSGSVVAIAPSGSVSASAAPSTSAVAAPSASVLVDGKQCGQFAMHASKLVKKEGARGIEECPKGAITDQSMDDAKKKKLFDDADLLTGELIKACIAHQGKTVGAKDARCFLDAQTTSAWTACGFQGPPLGELETKAKAFGRTWAKKCGETSNKAPEF